MIQIKQEHATYIQSFYKNPLQYLDVNDEAVHLGTQELVELYL